MGPRAAKRAAALAALVALGLCAPHAPAAECAGDECQGTPPAPEEVIPATAVIEGPPNPPVRFPQHHKPKHHKKHHHKKHHGQAKKGARR